MGTRRSAQGSVAVKEWPLEPHAGLMPCARPGSATTLWVVFRKEHVRPYQRQSMRDVKMVKSPTTGDDVATDALHDPVVSTLEVYSIVHILLYV